MWRSAGSIGVVVLLGLCLGCPRPIETGAPVKRFEMRVEADESGWGESLNEPVQPSEGTTAESAATPWSGPPLPDDPATGSAQALVGPEAPASSTEAVTGVPPALEADDTWIDPLDPRSVLGQSSTAQPAGPSANTALTSESIAGLWVVIAASQAGQGRAVDLEGDRWLYQFEPDGSCTVSLARAGYNWVREGTWTLAGDQLSLAMGPGGNKAYRVEVDRVLPELCLLQESDGAVLFCLRLAESAPLLELAPRYETTFGTLNLAQQSQMEWTGTYGQPEGNLRLRLMGTMLAGQWTQGANNGMVVLRQSEDGFLGRWWNINSTQIDGNWIGKVTTGNP